LTNRSYLGGLSGSRGDIGSVCDRQNGGKGGSGNREAEALHGTASVEKTPGIGAILSYGPRGFAIRINKTTKRKEKGKH